MGKTPLRATLKMCFFNTLNETFFAGPQKGSQNFFSGVGV
jgi:hypothetical protein